MFLHKTTKEMKISLNSFRCLIFLLYPGNNRDFESDLMAKWTSKSRADGSTGAKQGRSSVAELGPPVHTRPQERPSERPYGQPETFGTGPLIR